MVPCGLKLSLEAVYFILLRVFHSFESEHGIILSRMIYRGYQMPSIYGRTCKFQDEKKDYWKIKNGLQATDIDSR